MAHFPAHPTNSQVVTPPHQALRLLPSPQTFKWPSIPRRHALLHSRHDLPRHPHRRPHHQAGPSLHTSHGCCSHCGANTCGCMCGKPTPVLCGEPPQWSSDQAQEQPPSLELLGPLLAFRVWCPAPYHHPNVMCGSYKPPAWGQPDDPPWQRSVHPLSKAWRQDCNGFMRHSPRVGQVSLQHPWLCENPCPLRATGTLGGDQPASTLIPCRESAPAAVAATCSRKQGSTHGCIVLFACGCLYTYMCVFLFVCLCCMCIMCDSFLLCRLFWCSLC
jgi:hypothetical protein